jgi:hypothetical protein
LCLVGLAAVAGGEAPELGRWDLEERVRHA